MPSPFPGMDPYLEHPSVFPGLHDRLITYLSETLQSQLPDPYYAEISDRVWVEVSSRTIGPDVNVLTRKQKDRTSGTTQSGMGTALQTKPVVVTVPHDEYREPLIEIFSRIEGERLVTLIEVLSLTNKTPGAQGRELYLRKQREILDSKSNLVEIDLLRDGRHTTAVPRELAEEKAGSFDYHVCIHRYHKFEDFLVYPIRLEQKLPEIEVPLLPGDEPIPVDLQSVFDRSYDAGPYHRRVLYLETTPVPPLSSSHSEWAKGLFEKRKQEG